MLQVAALQQELQQLQMAELQAHKLLQDQESQQHQKQREATAQLEEALRAAATRTSELSAQANLAQMKVQRLENQLGVAVAGRRELEAQLERLCSALRHTVCSPEDRSFSGPGRSHRRWSPSPRRRHLVKGRIR